jgi:hypothetical protein
MGYHLRNHRRREKAKAQSLDLDFVGLMNNHLQLTAAGAYQNAASMPYYGKGSNSIKNNQSDFRREFTSAHFGGQFHFLDQKLSAGYAIGGLLVNVGPGDLGDWPSTDKIFNEANTPGLEKQSNFITGTASITANLTTPSFSNPKGLILEAQDTQFWDQSGNNSSFHLLQTQTYRQKCNCPLRIQKAGRHHRTLVIAAAEETTSSQRPGCIHRTNDHAPTPAGESRSGA